MAEDAKKKAADEKAALAKVQSTQRERATGKPTPTQEELDAAMTGESVKLEPDGSAVEGDLNVKHKDLEASKPHGGYDTRAMAPATGRRAPASE